MISSLRHSVILVFFLFSAGFAFAQFPYRESFRNSTAPGITFGGAPSAFLTAAGSSAAGGTPIDPEGDGYLRLTNNTTNQKGYIYSNALFPSTNGLRVDFEYYVYGGTGADGISLFLFDATADPFNIGGFGGSLGYAQITTTTPVSPGVSKGYLAIGLDEFGNFSNPTEGRQGGIGRVAGSVTLRGRGNGAALTADNYRYLTSVKTSAAPFNFNLTSGGNARQPNSASSGYRRAIMELVPNPAGGYNISVRIITGGSSPTVHNVITNYHYADPAPATLRYGIASSTGASTNYHEIRNVFIDVIDPNGLIKATAVNDTVRSCAGKEVIVNAAANDRSENTNGVIDRYTIDLDPDQAGQQTTYTIPGQGVFILNSEGYVVFTPESSFSGVVRKTYIVTDIYGATSSPAEIIINYSPGPAPPSAGQNAVLNISAESTGSYTLSANQPQPDASGRWTQVSGPDTALFVDSALYNTRVNNLTNGTYVFRWTVTTSAGCSEYADMQLVVNRIPVAVNDSVTTALNIDIPIAILANDTDADGNNTIDKGSITIKSQPSHGTVLVDNVSGQVTYKPQSGYSGYDSFVYSVKDNYGAESNHAIVTIAINVKPEGSPDNAFTVAETSVTVRVLDNDQGRIGASVLKNTDPLNGTIAVNTEGTITYTPTTGFSGIDRFTYRLQNQQALISDPITVTINVRPAGSPDNASTPVSTSVTISVKDNDISKTGTTVIPNTTPEHGSIAVNINGTVAYTPQSNYAGTDVFSYRLRTADGLESDAITVTVTISGIPPKAPDVEAEASSGNPTVIDIPVPPGSKIVITDPPKHGTITIDPETGEVIYTPDPGYTGPDDFSYVIEDGDGNQSSPGRVIIEVSRPAKIGLAKALTSMTKNPDGSYNLKFTFTIVNYGDFRINSLSLTDDLAGTFPGTTVSVRSITGTGTLQVNNNYNGTADKELLLPASSVAARWKEIVELELTVALAADGATFYNSAFVQGTAENTGNAVSDQSTNGLSPDPNTAEDPGPSELTPVKLVKQSLLIPGGFSPNNDGINDYFVIENASEKQVSLEVFNRWGNRIYRSENYQNDWNGKCTEGLHIGEDVPVGTYYYVIVIDHSEKKVGYITINR